jgi:hypothetical protein
MIGLAPETRRLDFDGINRAAISVLPGLLKHWLPDWRRHGREYFARNPNRSDRAAGSFAVNLHTGKWSDFATGDRGGDVISLAAFLFNLSQGDAARRLADMLGVKDTI